MHQELRDQLGRKDGLEVLRNRELIDRFRAYVASVPWGGRTGATDRRILDAYLDIAWAAGQTVFTASERQVAPGAGCLRESVGRALRDPGRLSPKWLVVLERGRGKTGSTLKIRCDVLQNAPLKANNYRIHTASLSGSGSSSNGVIGRKSVCVGDPDLFRSGGLTAAQLQIFRCLSPYDPTNVANLVKSTGRGQSTAYKALHRLEEVGLAVQRPDGWCRVGGSTEELRELQHELAREVFCTAGTTDRHRVAYQQESAQYRQRRDGYLSNRGYFGTKLPTCDGVGEFDLDGLFDQVWHRLHADQRGLLWTGSQKNSKMARLHDEQVRVFSQLWNSASIFGSGPEWLAGSIIKRHIFLDDLTDEGCIFSFVEESWQGQVGEICGALSRAYGRQLSPEEHGRIRMLAVDALSQGIATADVEIGLVACPSVWEGFELVPRDTVVDDGVW